MIAASSIVRALDFALTEACLEPDQITRDCEKRGVRSVALKLLEEVGFTDPASRPLVEWLDMVRAEG